MAVDPEIFLHKEWLGLLQPVGLVVSPLALSKHQAVVNRGRAVELQARLQAITSTEPIPGRIEAGTAWIENFPAFAEQVLEWLPEDLVGAPEQNLVPTALEVVLPDYNETLRPTYAVREPDSGQWLMLVQMVKPGLSLDEVDPEVEKGHGWKATIQAKFERLLRETQIPIGLLCNGIEIRLVYAPRGESSGHLTFPVQAMTEVAGRLILGALEMLIGADRLFNVPSDRRLPKILSDSRDYQAEVSTKLADQVLDALWELLRGFQAADAAVAGALLQELAKTDPQHIYGGLLTTLMRLVFLLYAEDEGLMPDDSVYQQNYSVSGLYERLREDAGNYPDTMDLRYGAWTWLLSLFRLVYDGGGYTPEYLPARHGQLFEPDEYPFLEGQISPSPQVERGSGGEVKPQIPGYIYELCRQLRSSQTSTEDRLWQTLRNRQLGGFKFRRQHPLGRYIADFYCAEKGLVIELNGGVHNTPDQQEYDAIRDEILQAQNLTVLRFSNDAVESEMEKVLGEIFQVLTSPPSPLSINGEGGQEKRWEVPRIPDGVIYRVLENLLMLDGERLSYRSLDVEQIGSVYEAIMGFEVQVAQGLSIAVRPKDVVVNVEALLTTKPKDRAKVLKDEAECKLTGKALTALSEAKTPEELLAALDRKVSSSRTPNLLPVGSLFLQPGEERRRTGSHYTPRKLTQPIVETTLRPVLEGLGERPTAEQILELKVCDLAMGSGAFLVEACRQLAEKVVEAWEYHGNFTAYLPSCHPHPPTPSPIKGEGEPDRWEVPESLHQKMVEVARQFRKEPTPSEEILWQALRGKKLQGKKFRRQQPIGSFIVDFFCPSAKLIVEVDGGIHESQRELDKARQELLESLGLQFIRFPSSLVENDLPKALEAIRAALNTLTPHPSPIKGEGNRTLAPFSPGGRRAGDEGEQPRPVAREVEPLLAARRLVAQRCLYGVDKNPFAVNLAKLSLWLVTLAKDRPFTFVDHALKCGDSLVGVSKLQVSRFMAASDLSGSALIEMLEDNAQKSKFYRDLIAFADEKADEDDEQKRGYLKQADSESRDSRILSDVVVASFFASNRSHTDDLNDEKLMSDVALAAFFSTLSKSKRDAKKIAKDLATKVNLWRLGTIDRSEVELIARIPRQFKRPVSSFHWEFEFPEVFNRENPGSDAIAGNPPFAGKNTLINAHPEGYLPWLQDIHPESHGNADLVAHFFRRAFNLLRQGGTLGLIATNTIAQGDTRSTGLRFICNNGGTIYNAQKRVKWPGLAAVVVSVVHIFKANPRNLGGP